ncbi:hypothetical protein VZT92_003463 [Zoarces viviparus]|uniref:Uncharacterized protein n=1 Tax=Zoarces viviparus TaxID=48416 RepID=A0AAW1FVP1_ZOAVI
MLETGGETEDRRLEAVSRLREEEPETPRRGIRAAGCQVSSSGLWGCSSSAARSRQRGTSSPHPHDILPADNTRSTGLTSPSHRSSLSPPHCEL